MTDLWEATKEHVKARFENPLLGAFALSWLIWNYKLIIIIVGKMDPTNKIDYIASQLYATNLQKIGCVAAPLVFSLFYLLIYPELDRWLSVQVEQRRIKKSQALERVQHGRLLTATESKELQGKMIELEIEKQRLVKEAQDEAHRISRALTLVTSDHIRVKDDLIKLQGESEKDYKKQFSWSEDSAETTAQRLQNWRQCFGGAGEERYKYMSKVVKTKVYFPQEIDLAYSPDRKRADELMQQGVQSWTLILLDNLEHWGISIGAITETLSRLGVEDHRGRGLGSLAFSLEDEGLLTSNQMQLTPLGAQVLATSKRYFYSLERIEFYKFELPPT
ncbi:MAG: hypothetical protein ACRERR_05180 [Moraxellaceae bacterium]